MISKIDNNFLDLYYNIIIKNIMSRKVLYNYIRLYHGSRYITIRSQIINGLDDDLP
jgi:hypothetical protein